MSSRMSHRRPSSGRRGEGDWDISEGGIAGVLQQSLTSFPHHSSPLRSTMPRVLYTYPHISRGTTATFSSTHPSHWGQGPMETSDYIVNTLKTLVQFTQPFTTRYILGTFQMLPCHLSNMCLQNNISNVSRILPQMFPTCTQKSHGDQSEKNWAHAEYIYNVPM